MRIFYIELCCIDVLIDYQLIDLSAKILSSKFSISFDSVVCVSFINDISLLLNFDGPFIMLSLIFAVSSSEKRLIVDITIVFDKLTSK